MPRVFLSLPFAALLLAAFSSSAQPAPGINQDILGKIHERMHHFVQDKTVAGVVTLVARGNDVVEFDAQGMADIEANRPMRKDTIFQIMSMTKPVTAIGIMMLAEEGKLAVRDPVEQYLPEFKDLGAHIRQKPLCLEAFLAAARELVTRCPTPAPANLSRRAS